MTKETFNKLDLRNQLTDELKERWYYQDRKWGLRINKHSVVFDNTFKFELKYKDNEFYNDPEFSDESQGYVVVYEDGEIKWQLCDYDAIYDDDDDKKIKDLTKLVKDTKIPARIVLDRNYSKNNIHYAV